jgi:hypothetical protein
MLKKVMSGDTTGFTKVLEEYDVFSGRSELDEGIESVPGNSGWTAFHYVAAAGQHRMVAVLVRREAAVNKTSHD